MTHRALIVAAVSTPDQATEDKASIPRQLEDCRRACEIHGWQIAEEIVIPGHSRNYDDLVEIMADCPEYGRIIKAINNNEITLLVAWAYDRLWRTDSLRGQVTRTCRKHHVQVYALDAPMEPSADGNTAFGTRAMETLKGLFSEDENEKRVLRMNAGKEGIIRSGGVQYGAYIPYGYLRTGPRSIAQDPVTAPVVVLIFDLRVNERLGYHAIARELNRRGIPSPLGGVWRHKAIIDILRNPVYKGETRWGKAHCEHGRHEPLVSQEIWERAQLVLAVYRNTSPFDRPLAGLCRCGYCGYAMAYERPQPAQHKPKQLRCGHYLAGGNSCVPNSNNADRIEAYVLDIVRDTIQNREVFLAARQSDDERARIDAQMIQIDAELASLTERKRRVFSLFERGGIPEDEYIEHRKGVDRRIEELQLDKRRLLARGDELASLAVTLEKYAERLDELTAMPADELHALYVSLIREITITRGQMPEIHWV